MPKKTVGMRELKTQVGRYLRRIVAGDTTAVTIRGQPTGQIVPSSPSAQVAPNGRKPGSAGPLAHCHGSRTVADRLLEDRE